jgi:hypothetical protein
MGDRDPAGSPPRSQDPAREDTAAGTSGERTGDDVAGACEDRDSAGLRAVSLLTDLDAFYLEHRQCGELAGGVDRAVVWIDCECGAKSCDR